MPWLEPKLRSPCPCCGYPTLGMRGAFEICQLCGWEDDGQNEADELRGGPNHGYTLAEARQNFRRFGVMYEPERDPRISAPDSERTQTAKSALKAAFDQWAAGEAGAQPAILAEIRRHELTLQQELKRAIKEYEAQCRRERRLASEGE